MTVHVAHGTDCPKGCDYCYEEQDREYRGADGSIKTPDYDMDAIMSRLRSFKEQHPGERPGLHGGEPTMMDDDDMEHIFRWVHENYEGGGHIQTGGGFLSPRHISMFDEYDVGVGISVDGPPELNTLRKARIGGEDATERMSVNSLREITKLREAGVGVGIIVVLHEANAGTDDKLEKLLSWMDNLNRMGVYGHYNPAIPYEDVQTDVSLSPERLAEVFVRTWEWMNEPGMTHRSWNPMRDMQNNLLGLGLGNCVMNKCDVANAGAAKLVLGDGNTGGCGKTAEPYGDGATFLQGPSAGNEYNESEVRYDMLKQVPGPYSDEVQDGDVEDQGGCEGCRYWNVCHGGCPSAGIDGDWRNRTVWCKPYYRLYERMEEDMRQMFPALKGRMITDLPWNAEVDRLTASRRLDHAPFAGMRPDLSNRASVMGSGDHGKGGDVSDHVPDEYLPEQTWGRKVKNAKEKYDEDDLVIDHDTMTIHADSNAGEWERVDE